MRTAQTLSLSGRCVLRRLQLYCEAGRVVLEWNQEAGQAEEVHVMHLLQDFCLSPKRAVWRRSIAAPIRSHRDDAYQLSLHIGSSPKSCKRLYINSEESDPAISMPTFSSFPCFAFLN